MVQDGDGSTCGVSLFLPLIRLRSSGVCFRWQGLAVSCARYVLVSTAHEVTGSKLSAWSHHGRCAGVHSYCLRTAGPFLTFCRCMKRLILALLFRTFNPWVCRTFRVGEEQISAGAAHSRARYFQVKQPILQQAKEIDGLRSICSFCSRMKRGAAKMRLQLYAVLSFISRCAL